MNRPFMNLKAMKKEPLNSKQLVNYFKELSTTDFRSIGCGV
jgi:hypothetical protein